MNTRADQGKAQFGMTPFPQRFRAFIWPATTVTVHALPLTSRVQTDLMPHSPLRPNLALD